MRTGELITVTALFALAGAMLILALRQFGGKGIPLNNAWLYVSEKERETMDKRPYYRQSGIVFSILSALFVMLGLSLMLRSSIFIFFEIILGIAVVVYAIASTVRINRQKKK